MAETDYSFKFPANIRELKRLSARIRARQSDGQLSDPIYAELALDESVLDRYPGLPVYDENRTYQEEQAVIFEYEDDGATFKNVFVAKQDVPFGTLPFGSPESVDFWQPQGSPTKAKAQRPNSINTRPARFDECPTGGTVLTVNDQSFVLCNGLIGSSTGDETIDITVSTRSATRAECPAGGSVVTVNDQQIITCNGSHGTDGRGIPAEFLNARVATASECPAGGTILRVGAASYFLCNGTDGKDGEDGKNTEAICSVTSTAVSGGRRVTFLCDGVPSSFVISNGTDGTGGSGNPCTVSREDISEGDLVTGTRYTFNCGSTSESFDVTDGKDGKDGSDSNRNGRDGTAPSVETESASDVECQYGGTKITIGDESYITCNGAPAEDGEPCVECEDGQDGKDGTGCTHTTTAIAPSDTHMCGQGGGTQHTITCGSSVETFPICNGIPEEEEDDCDVEVTPSSIGALLFRVIASRYIDIKQTWRVKITCGDKVCTVDFTLDGSGAFSPSWTVTPSNTSIGSATVNFSPAVNIPIGIVSDLQNLLVGNLDMSFSVQCDGVSHVIQVLLEVWRDPPPGASGGNILRTLLRIWLRRIACSFLKGVFGNFIGRILCNRIGRSEPPTDPSKGPADCPGSGTGDSGPGSTGRVYFVDGNYYVICPDGSVLPGPETPAGCTHTIPSIREFWSQARGRSVTGNQGPQDFRQIGGLNNRSFEVNCLDSAQNRTQCIIAFGDSGFTRSTPGQVTPSDWQDLLTAIEVTGARSTTTTSGGSVSRNPDPQVTISTDRNSEDELVNVDIAFICGGNSYLVSYKNVPYGGHRGSLSGGGSSWHPPEPDPFRSFEPIVQVG